MVLPDWLDTYEVHEKEEARYDGLYESFEWVVTDEFNIARFACDRWAEYESLVGLYFESADDDQTEYTFRELLDYANCLANNFDRVPICASFTLGSADTDTVSDRPWTRTFLRMEPNVRANPLEPATRR